MRVFDQVDPQRVERRELQLTMLSLSVNAILAAGAALLMYPTISAHPVIFGDTTSRVIFVGFCVSLRAAGGLSVRPADRGSPPSQ